jgi:hypothetical protein
MSYVIEYDDGDRVMQTVIRDCADIHDALAKFAAQYGNLRVLSMMPTNL